MDCLSKKNYICTIMQRSEIHINIINYLRPYNPERIGIFGSFARKEETPESDIDILVKFKETLSLLDLAKIHRELSQILGKDVDLVTEASVKNEKLKKYIYNDLKIIFE
jgi:predicted nucleotidyltransferase